MPSYQLTFDHRGEPRLVEEFSGDCPDEVGFRAAIQGLIDHSKAQPLPRARRESTAADFAVSEHWALAIGASDSARCDASHTQRPAPFGFE